ncbi:oxidoreductase [Novosphingobium sp. MMS21-SN21R]|uniref:oxidoreductase n=1 Tax=Novosphingobium sp. MMS21-SN21R TaxID=2969298 RepID=UPI0028854051|nr:oxidoreductase [Novosphingobium sp. MMS21-SN21R]MDT0507155.1 oxidoreductase [Novosphingobium sp. MMS21-SN21R]
MSEITAGGSFMLGDRLVNRIGYGAMQLAGAGAFGPPRDRAAAVAVLRAAVTVGVNHIDTSDYYGPHVTNQIIREALQPYGRELTIVTKVGARRGTDGSWLPAQTREDLIQAVDDNLRNLGIDTLDVVNLRMMGGMLEPKEESVGERFSLLADLRRQGKIRHLGLSNATAAQIAEAQAIAPVVCVQNQYNIVYRGDDAMIDALAAQDIAFVPFFPLGGFTPIQSDTLSRIAAGLSATPMQVAAAWLLARSPNVLVIPGTSNTEHLKQNLAAATLTLPADIKAELDGMVGAAGIEPATPPV